MTREVPTTFSGGCACGAIRYTCGAAPERMVNCHCRDCQRAGGTGHAPSVIVTDRHFRITAGDPRVYGSVSETGNTVRRTFCGHCGSPLFARSSARPEIIAIRAGSLDDPGWFRAGTDVWTESAQPWVILSDETEKYPRTR